MKVLLYLRLRRFEAFYKPGFFRKISQTSLPWQKRTEEVSQVSCSKEVSLISADITEEKVTSRKIGHKISHAISRPNCPASPSGKGWTDRLHANKNLCMCKSGHRPRHKSLIFMFHAGREFKPEHAENFQGVTPSRVERPNRLARPGQGSELRASNFHLPRAGPSPNSAESAPESRQYLSNWRKPSKALKRTELRTPPPNFQLAKPLGAVSKHENPKPACAVHASAIVSSPEPVFALLSLGHITGCDLVRIPNGWASVSLGDRLFSDSTAAFLNADQCLILQGMDAWMHGVMILAAP